MKISLELQLENKLELSLNLKLWYYINPVYWSVFKRHLHLNTTVRFEVDDTEQSEIKDNERFEVDDTERFEVKDNENLS